MNAARELAPLYDTDFVGWTQDQADALRARRLDRLDIDNLVEEVESMGRQVQAELTNRLAVLLAHLLNWQLQPQQRERHGRSWQLTADEQRVKIERLVRKNPSLQPFIAEAMNDAYREAVPRAARETKLDKPAFPPSSPWTFDQATADDWMPD